MPDTDHTESFEQARAGLPDLSPNASVFWKPLRRLLGYEDGTPIGPVTILFYDIAVGRRLPFAALAKTRANRLILWPPSSDLEDGEFADGRHFAVHHVTLELANGETHLTRFDASGQRVHADRVWKLASFEDGLRLWLMGAFHVKLLEKQVGALERDVRMPKGDSKRREDEFQRYAAQMTRVLVNTPPLRGDCLLTAMHLLPDAPTFRAPLRPTHFPMGSFWNEWIEGWPDGDSLQIAPTAFTVGGVNLLLFTASPLGRLKGGCFLGGVDPKAPAA